MPITDWLAQRGLDAGQIIHSEDLQAARLFPICHTKDELEKVLRWMTSEPELQTGKTIWMQAQKLSADEISAYANLRRLASQREEFRKYNWSALADNYEKSIFYQLNLQDAAEEFTKFRLPLPHPLPDSAPLMTRH